MDYQKEMIDNHFGGDTELFDAVIADGRRRVIQWRDIEECAIVLPYLEEKAVQLIEERLGWLPHESVRLKYEPYLRGLLQNYLDDHIAVEALMYYIDEHVKLIRNEEMSGNTCLDYDDSVYRRYDTDQVYYREAARQRVIYWLGYEPELRHSLTAELWLRDILAEDSFHLSGDVTAVDWKALTLIRYREILLAEGKEAADASELMAVEPFEKPLALSRAC
jgi:hypothetical protein